MLENSGEGSRKHITSLPPSLLAPCTGAGVARRGLQEAGSLLASSFPAWGLSAHLCWKSDTGHAAYCSSEKQNSTAPPLPRPSHFFISRLIAAFKSLTQILLCPALRSYPALAVVSGVDPRGKVLAARRAIRGLLPGVLCCAQGDKRGEGRGRAPGRSEPPAFPDPQPSPAPADSGTLGLAPGAVGGADLAWPRAARWHSKATPGHGRGMPRRKSSC